MKSDKLQDAVGMIKDEYLIEAENAGAAEERQSTYSLRGESDKAHSVERSAKQRKRSFGKIFVGFGAAAAVLLLAVGIGIIMPDGTGMHNASNDRTETAELDEEATKGEEAEGNAQESDEPGKNGASNGEAGGVSFNDPQTAVNAGDIEKESGISIALPQGASDDVWTKSDAVDGRKTLYQVEYKLNGDTYRFRICETGTLEDISGMDCDWTISNEVAADGSGEVGNPGEGSDILYTLKMTDEGRGKAYWFRSTETTGYSFSVSMPEGAKADKLDAMYRHFTASVSLPQA